MQYVFRKQVEYSAWNLAAFTLRSEGRFGIRENIKRAAWLPQSKIKLSALLEHNFKKRQQIHGENTHCSFHKYSLFQVEYFECWILEMWVVSQRIWHREGGKALKRAHQRHTFAFQLLKTDVNKVHINFSTSNLNADELCNATRFSFIMRLCAISVMSQSLHWFDTVDDF